MNLFEPQPHEPLALRYIGDTNAIMVDYHIYRWSQVGRHQAELRTNAPLTLPTLIDGDTFSDFIDNLYKAEREYNFVATLTWS